MLKTKRTIAVLLALVLCVASFASCGKSNKKDGTAGADLLLTVWNTQGTDYIFKTLDEDIPAMWLTEKTGVAVGNIYGNGGGQWDSQLQRFHAGNNMPDILWCQSSQGPAHFNKLNDLNRLYLLDEELLKEHAPNIWKMIPEEVWDQFRTADGKITGIPFGIHKNYVDHVYAHYDEELRADLLSKQTTPTTRVQNTFYIRDDILKKIYPECMSYDEMMALLEEKQAPIGEEIMDIPIKTTQEYIDFMYKIKDLNIVEDGKPVYAFGYAGDPADNWEALVYLGNAMYGSNWHQYTAHWNTKEHKVELMLMSDLVKQMAKTQNQMLIDGVIDRESTIHTNAQFQAKIFQGNYAICSATRAGDIASVNKQIKESGKTFQYRPFWVDIPAPEGYDPFEVVNTFASSFAITTELTDEEVIKVLKWADLQFTDEFAEIYSWGRPEDGLYEEKDGKRLYKDENFNKYFIEGDSTVLDVSQTKGLNGGGSKFKLLPMTFTKYTPTYMAQHVRLTPTPTTGLKFSPDSEYATCVQAAPPSYAYSSEFGAVQPLVEYWGKRQQWEIRIQEAIAAEEGKFEEKWQLVYDEINAVCDYKLMEKEMTDIALTYWETLKSQDEEADADVEATEEVAEEPAA